MAPIYDTDLEDERWEKEGWKNFELWEKISQRLKKKRRIIVFAVVLIFLFLSSVPVYWDRLPYWEGLSLSYQLRTEILNLKKSAVVEHRAFRLRFIDDADGNGLSYVVESLVSCQSTNAQFVREGTFYVGVFDSEVKRVGKSDAALYNLQEVADELCYDPIEGAYYGSLEKDKALFVFSRANDLTSEDKRVDRVRFITVEKLTAEISFN